jgi:FlgN protein
MNEPMAPAHTAESAVYDRALAHIAKEFALLKAIVDASRQIRAAIDNGGGEALAAALHVQNELIPRATDMSAQRQLWREDAGASLGMAPASVTLATVAAALGGAAQTTLVSARDRLRQQVQEVARMNRASAFLVRTYLETLQRFFLDLTGSGEASGRYSRGGACPPPTYGSLLHTRG